MNVESKARRAPKAKLDIIQLGPDDIVPGHYEVIKVTRRFKYAIYRPPAYAPPTPPGEENMGGESQGSFVPPEGSNSYDNGQPDPDIDALIGYFQAGMVGAEVAPAPAPPQGVAAPVLQVPVDEFDAFMAKLGDLRLGGGALRRKRAKKSKKSRRSKVTKGKKNTRRS